MDLRTSFAEWYQRYRYSPAFQAKILDLVLKLGDDGTVLSAESERLTIGEPAVPALEAHASSRNSRIRDRSVSLLLRLGRLPPPEEVVETDRWARDIENWRALWGAPPEYRRALAAQATGAGFRAAALRALAGDEETVRTALAFEPALEQMVIRHLAMMLLGAGEPDPEALTRLETIAGLPNATAAAQEYLVPLLVWYAPTLERLIEWPARVSPVARPAVWAAVAYALSQRLGPMGTTSLESVLPRLTDPDGRIRVLEQLVAQARGRGQPPRFPWRASELRALRETLTQQPARETLRGLLSGWLHDENLGRGLVDAVLEDPLSLDPSILSNGLVKRFASVEEVHVALERSWPGWSSGQREALLQGIAAGLDAYADPRTEGILLRRLQEPGTGLETKRVILERLHHAGVAGVRDIAAVADLTDLAQANLFLPMLQRLVPDAEAYDAFAVLRRHPEREVRQALYQRFMRQGVTSSPIADRLVADMLADEEGAIRGHAVGWIADRRAAQDTPIFVRALSDPDTGVRHAAAVALRGAYDRTAIEALVAALDDPVAAVRDEALKALQTIEEFERQKEKWRKFAEEAK